MFFCFKCMTVGSRLVPTLFSFHTQPSTAAIRTTFNSLSHQKPHFLLEKCSNMTELKQIHAHGIRNGFTQDNLTVGKIIAFCAISNNGNLQYARLIFDKIAEPNKYMWNSLIRGYSNSKYPRQALSLHQRMVASGLSPNEFTLPFVLKACACESAYWEAVLIHGQSIKLGIGSQVCVQNALINVYTVCGLIHSARQMFDDIYERTLVSWNSIISAYSRFGYCMEVFSLFQKMRDLGVEPDEYTLVNLLSACSHSRSLDLGRFVHSFIEVTGAKTDLCVWNALLDLYAKCGDIGSAKKLFSLMSYRNVVSWTAMVNAYARQGLLDLARCEFDHMPEKNVVSWNSMISCYVQHGKCREALDLFIQMRNSRVDPDEATLVSILAACSQIGDLVMGKRTHSCIHDYRIGYSVRLYNALIDMYAKCGSMPTASDIFNQMPERNVVSWNIMIGGHAMHGYGLEAVNLFERMQNEGTPPDNITFTGLLCACSHSGLVDIGQYYFENMQLVYGIPHDIEHYACMVDLLGRRGHLEEAIKLIGRMPMKPDIVIWGALLGACRIHVNVRIGEQILKQILESELHGGELYVLISNIYCEAHRWEDVKKVRKLMKSTGIRKCKALSFIEIDGNVHEFIVEDKRHEVSSNIYSMLDQLTDHLRSRGHICIPSRTFFEVEEL